MTTWWNNNIETRMGDFKAWIGDFNQPSKVYCRKYIAENQYKSILDCGCGLATDYYGFKEDNYTISYMGLDSCKFLVESNQNQGISMIHAELETNIPILDNCYEVVYCREVLEHLSFYEKCFNEMIRIGSKEVLVVFFIKPGPEEDQINYWETEDLYHNKYDKEKLENFLASHSKVDKFFWVDVADIPYSVEPIKVESPVETIPVEEIPVEVIPVEEMPVEEMLPIEEPEKPTGEKSILHILLKQL